MTFANTQTAQISLQLGNPYSEIPRNAEEIVLMSASARFAGLSLGNCSEILLCAMSRGGATRWAWSKTAVAPALHPA